MVRSYHRLVINSTDIFSTAAGTFHLCIQSEPVLTLPFWYWAIRKCSLNLLIKKGRKRERNLLISGQSIKSVPQGAWWRVFSSPDESAPLFLCSFPDNHHRNCWVAYGIEKLLIARVHNCERGVCSAFGLFLSLKWCSCCCCLVIAFSGVIIQVVATACWEVDDTLPPPLPSSSSGVDAAGKWKWVAVDRVSTVRGVPARGCTG